MKSDLGQGVRTTLKQFPFLSAWKRILGRAVGKVLAPDAIVTYAQTGEDRVIDYYVGYPETGFYVDVGCHHPSSKSNTMRLYERGWRGLCIDANAALLRTFRRSRPRDVCVEAVVSAGEREAVFTEFEDTLISSVSEDFVRSKVGARITGTRTVRTVTLTALCRQYDVPERFDLLTIDCEGHDYEVLTSLDLDLFRPRVIVVEIHDLDLEALSQNRLCSYLHTQGYTLCGYSTMNGYFVDRESTAG